jgi:hypothetical protein
VVQTDDHSACIGGDGRSHVVMGHLIPDDVNVSGRHGGSPAHLAQARPRSPLGLGHRVAIGGFAFLGGVAPTGAAMTQPHSQHLSGMDSGARQAQLRFLG